MSSSSASSADRVGIEQPLRFLRNRRRRCGARLDDQVDACRQRGGFGTAVDFLQRGTRLRDELAVADQVGVVAQARELAAQFVARRCVGRRVADVGHQPRQCAAQFGDRVLDRLRLDGNRLRRFAEALRDQRRDDPFAIGTLLLDRVDVEAEPRQRFGEQLEIPPRRPACRDWRKSRSASGTAPAAGRRRRAPECAARRESAGCPSRASQARTARVWSRKNASSTCSMWRRFAWISRITCASSTRSCAFFDISSSTGAAVVDERPARAASRRSSIASTCWPNSGDRLLKFSNALSASSSAVANSIASGSETPSAGMSARRATRRRRQPRQRGMLDLRRLRIG